MESYGTSYARGALGSSAAAALGMGSAWTSGRRTLRCAGPQDNSTSTSFPRATSQNMVFWHEAARRLAEVYATREEKDLRVGRLSLEQFPDRYRF